MIELVNDSLLIDCIQEMSYYYISIKLKISKSSGLERLFVISSI